MTSAEYTLVSRRDIANSSKTLKAPATEVFFTSSAYGAPVIMGDRNGQHFVEEWRRFGEELNPSWIRNFFS